METDRAKVMLGLLTARTQAGAAAAVGCSTRTIQRLLADPDFAREYADLQRAVIVEVVARLVQAGLAATDALERNLNAGPPSVQVRSADRILAHALRGRELVEIEERLAALEAVMKERP